MLALEDEHNDGGDVLEHPDDVLPEVHLHAARVIGHRVLLADDLHLAQEDPVVEDEEEQREQVLGDGQQLQDQVWCRICNARQLDSRLPYGCAVFDGPQESQDLAGPSHLDIDVVGGALGEVLLGVKSRILHEPQDLGRAMGTLSLL